MSDNNEKNLNEVTEANVSEETKALTTESSEAGKNTADAVTSQFTNLPIGSLISAPFLEMARGQAALCEVYIDTLMKIAYKDPNNNKDNATRTLDFTYSRPVTDSVTGTVSFIKETINAPLLSLAPIPTFLMDSATVTFDKEVNVANSNSTVNTKEVSADTMEPIQNGKSS